MAVRDAGRSRERLLSAAIALFAERGYDRTTTRELGDRAGVDPALIARYFGNKTGLYLAALSAENQGSEPTDLLDHDRMADLLARVGSSGPGPVFRSVVSPHDDRQVQAATAATLRQRLVAPLEKRYRAAGRDRPRLRAELVVAAFVGVVVGRGSDALPQLSAASDESLIELLGELLGERSHRSG